MFKDQDSACITMAFFLLKPFFPDRKWQYLLFAAEPYETIAFKVPSREVDKTETKVAFENNYKAQGCFPYCYARAQGGRVKVLHRRGRRSNIFKNFVT
jgi:hypothetical protein